jgi:hypothetical protein
MLIKIKPILIQALLLGFVSTTNFILVYIFTNEIISYFWSFISMWILVDDLSVNQELITLTILHKDLTQKYITLDNDFKSMLKQKHDQTHSLTNVISENTFVLNDIKKIMISSSPLSASINSNSNSSSCQNSPPNNNLIRRHSLQITPKHRFMILENKNSCIW